MSAPQTYATKRMNEKIAEVLAALKPGQKIKITQIVRVGMKSWNATVLGTFRHVDSLATGLATDRLPEDDIIVPIVHFTKENKEMSSIAVDEHTKIEVVG